MTAITTCAASYSKKANVPLEIYIEYACTAPEALQLFKRSVFNYFGITLHYIALHYFINKENDKAMK